MHSYLVIGTNQRFVNSYVDKLISKLKVKPMEFTIKKIADTHDINSFTKLKTIKPTALVLKNADKATNESLSALLKNLEEPSKNITYILTASSEHKIPPTISSRCCILRVIGSKEKCPNQKNIDQFLKGGISEKLQFVSNIKKKEEAIVILENLITFLHIKLNSNCKNYLLAARKLKTAQKTLNHLYKNGNVTLQLTALVISINS